jgi:hypothetical protein
LAADGCVSGSRGVWARSGPRGGQAFAATERPTAALRTAATSATRSASNRRPTKPMICAETWSSHCASSMRQSSGRRSAASASSVSVASPTRNRRATDAQPERGRERVPLGFRQPLEVVEQRGAEWMHSVVGQLHLGLHPDGRDHTPFGGSSGQIAQQRALPHAGLAAQDDGPTPPGGYIGEDVVQRLTLRPATEQPLSVRDQRRASSPLSSR